MEKVAYQPETHAMITPSEVMEYLYCPRFVYFMHCMNIPQHEDHRFKVLKGREVHKRREKENRDYLRKKIGAVKKEIGVYLASPTLRVRGIVDEVLTLAEGTMAPLDYKYTEPSEVVYRTHRVQVILYGLMIEEAYGVPVKHGYVAYIRGGSQLYEVEIDSAARQEVKTVVNDIFRIIETGYHPKRTSYRVRCTDCCYKNICV
jgi:CRISPR-associated exonuclease Cas4